MQSNQISKLAHLDNFKFDNLLLMLGGDEEKIINLLLDFKLNMATAPLEVNNYILKKDFVSAQTLTHKLKGVVANLGALDLHNIIKSLDDKLKQGMIDNEALVLLFQHEFEKTLLAISTLKPEPTIVSNIIVNNNQLTEIAIKIDNALAEDDYIGKQTLEELQAHLVAEKADDFAQLCLEIKKMDYAKARLFLRNLVDLPAMTN